MNDTQTSRYSDADAILKSLESELAMQRRNRSGGSRTAVRAGGILLLLLMMLTILFAMNYFTDQMNRERAVEKPVTENFSPERVGQ